MSKPVGRPLKYRALLDILEDEKIYSPATIARLGEELGLVETEVPHPELMDQRVLIRHTLARYRVNHGFPEEGDGHVRIRGQGTSAGWTGERWKSDLEPLEPEVEEA